MKVTSSKRKKKKKKESDEVGNNCKNEIILDE